MAHKKTLIGTLGVAAALALVLSGCASSGASPSASATSGSLTKITVGVAPTAETTPAYLAQSLGYFTDAGLDVSLQVIQNGQAAVPALLNGQFQISASGSLQPFNAIGQSIDLKIVDDTGVNTFQVLVPASSPIQTVADLKGKTVGIVALNSSPSFPLYDMLQKANLTQNDIKQVALNQSQLPGALQAGQMDAIIVTEPYSTIGLNMGFRSIATEQVVAGYMMATSSYAAANSATIQAFVSAYDKAKAYAVANPDQARAIIGTNGQIDPAVLAKITLPDWSQSQFTIDKITQFTDQAFAFGLITPKPDVPSITLFPKS